MMYRVECLALGRVVASAQFSDESAAIRKAEFYRSKVYGGRAANLRNVSQIVVTRMGRVRPVALFNV